MADENSERGLGMLPGNATIISDLDAPSRPTDDPIDRVVDSIIRQGIHSDASGIYIEPTTKALRIRNRVNGFLEEGWTVEAFLNDGWTGPKLIAGMLFRRFRIMANLDPLDKTVPKGGRFTVKTDGKAIDIQISFLPTIHGEKIIMRIIGPIAPPLALHELGLDQENYASLLQWINKPSGMVIACGPGGAGKTTLLYACLNALDSNARKMVTIEDYLEYSIPGANQMLVKRSEGMTFPDTLNAALLLDPDVVLCRQMREQETARVAVEASCNDHLVLTALNIRSACAALLRLSDMGVERAQISAAINGIVTGAVVRRLCNHCKTTAAPDKIDPVLDELHAGALSGGYQIPEGAVFLRAVGCGQCGHTGYQGRIGLYEVLSCNPELINQLFQCGSNGEMTRAAVEHGMRTLLADGICKAVAGITTIDELSRTTLLALARYR